MNESSAIVSDQERTEAHTKRADLLLPREWRTGCVCRYGDDKKCANGIFQKLLLSPIVFRLRPSFA